MPKVGTIPGFLSFLVFLNLYEFSDTCHESMYVKIIQLYPLVFGRKEGIFSYLFFFFCLEHRFDAWSCVSWQSTTWQKAFEKN